MLDNVETMLSIQRRFSQPRATSKKRCEYDHLKKNKKQKLVSSQKQNNIFVLQRVTVYKLFHFVKCQLVFYFTRRQVQAHYDYRSFNFIYVFKICCI